MLSFLFGSCNARSKTQKSVVELDSTPNTSLLPIDSNDFPADRSLLKNYPFFKTLNLRGRVKQYTIKKYFAELKDGAWQTTQQVSGESHSHEFSEEGVLLRTIEYDTHNRILNFRLYDYKKAPHNYIVNYYEYYKDLYRTTHFKLDSAGRAVWTQDYFPRAGNFAYHKFKYDNPGYFMIDNTVDDEDSILMYKQYERQATGVIIKEYSREKFTPNTITLLTVTEETYNQHQDLVSFMQKNESGRIIDHYTISYEYDAAGNWISSLQQTGINGWSYKSLREIVYEQ